jgi:hypothetical protein
MAVDAEHPICPKHQTVMIPNPVEPLDAALPLEVTLPQGVKVFRCPILTCLIFYATGALQGFYTLQSNGELVPYLKRASA